MKLLLLLLALILLIGIGFFVLQKQRESPAELPNEQAQTREVKETETFEISEQLAQSILKNALDARFDATTATYTIANLDQKAGPELIIGASAQNTATIQVLTILNQKGEYERVGKLEYQEVLQGVPEVKQLLDITGDNQEEIIMSLMYGGAASWTEGILDVNFTTKAMHWVQLRNEEGKLQDAIFTLASSAAHMNVFRIQDADKDGRKEIVEIFTQTILDEIRCEALAYEWDTIVFAFDKTLSEQTLQDLGKDCAM